MTATNSQEHQEEIKPQPEKADWRVRLRAAYDNLDPLTKEEADMMRKSITEARERSIGENVPS